MQPTIICTAPETGVIYVNGRFAGEAARERPLFVPICPSGAAYLEYRPLVGEGSLARRVVFSGGAPMADGLAETPGLRCVAWPGGALEAEFALPDAQSECFLLEGLPCALTRGEDCLLEINGLRLLLPHGASRPQLLRLPGAVALTGEFTGGGQYLATLTADLGAQTGLLVAQRIDPVEAGLFSAIVDLGDSVGHGLLEQWLADGNGLNRVSSQSVWSCGAPRWPATAEGTMIAAVEAALAGQDAEASEYLNPALARDAPLAAIREVCDMCVPMKYGPPDARPRVGLLKAHGNRLAVVRPLYYTASPGGGRQGPWQIDGMEMGATP